MGPFCTVYHKKYGKNVFVHWNLVNDPKLAKGPLCRSFQYSQGLRCESLLSMPAYYWFLCWQVKVAAASLREESEKLDVPVSVWAVWNEALAPRWRRQDPPDLSLDEPPHHHILYTHTHTHHQHHPSPLSACPAPWLPSDSHRLYKPNPQPWAFQH